MTLIPGPTCRYGRRTTARLLPALLPTILSAVLASVLVAAPGGAAAQDGGRDALNRYVERTDELLVWAEDLVRETESDPARRVLGQAHDLHRRSREMMDRGRYTEAVPVARRARDAVWHAVRLAREAMGLEERIGVRAERFRDLHQDLTERATAAGDEQALRFLDRARSQADRAREMVRQGDFRQAWNLLDQAGDLMQRAARLLAAGAGPARLDAELDRARAAVDRARASVGPDADRRRRDLLDQAEEALQEAERARADGRPGRALQLSGLAASLARRAETGGAAADEGEAVRRQLDRFDARADRLADRVREADYDRATERFGQARRQRDRAAEHARAGETEQALRRIRAAHDLLNEVEDLLR